jgi:hypothetical protein
MVFQKKKKNNMLQAANEEAELVSQDKVVTFPDQKKKGTPIGQKRAKTTKKGLVITTDESEELQHKDHFANIDDEGEKEVKPTQKKKKTSSSDESISSSLDISYANTEDECLLEKAGPQTLLAPVLAPVINISSPLPPSYASLPVSIAQALPPLFPPVLSEQNQGPFPLLTSKY